MQLFQRQRMRVLWHLLPRLVPPFPALRRPSQILDIAHPRLFCGRESSPEMESIVIFGPFT